MSCKRAKRRKLIDKEETRLAQTRKMKLESSWNKEDKKWKIKEIRQKLEKRRQKRDKLHL
jgi:hypothetical protein